MSKTNPDISQCICNQKGRNFLAFIDFPRTFVMRWTVADNKSHFLHKISLTLWEVNLCLRSNQVNAILLLKQKKMWLDSRHVPTSWFLIMTKKILDTFVSYLSFLFIPPRPPHGLNNFRIIQCQGYCFFWKLHICHFQSMCGVVSCQLQYKFINFEGIKKAAIIDSLNRSTSFLHLQTLAQTTLCPVRSDSHHHLPWVSCLLTIISKPLLIGIISESHSLKTFCNKTKC